MTTIQVLFIFILILVQCTLGMALLYRGYSIMLSYLDYDSVKSTAMVLFERTKQFVMSTNGRRLTWLAVLIIPGSLPLMLIVALVKALRQTRVDETSSIYNSLG